MERNKGRTIETAAMKAGMTASGYIQSGKLPSEQVTEREWRTREDPFEQAWPLAKARLKEAPELEVMRPLKERLLNEYEDRVEIWFAGKLQERIERSPGRKDQINDRHIIDWLVRNPGAFGNYRYREDLFPHLLFRKLYDELCANMPLRKADLEYLRILKLAAYNVESDVLEALEKWTYPRYLQALQ